MDIVANNAIGRAQHALILAGLSSPVAGYVRQRGQGPAWPYKPNPDHAATALGVLQRSEQTDRLAAALRLYREAENAFYSDVHAGAADAAGHHHILMLRLLAHGAERSTRFLAGIQDHLAAGHDMSALNTELVGALRCATLARAIATEVLDGQHAAALATAGAALEASTALWVDEADYLFTAAHRVVEQTGRARQWREEPLRASKTEARHRTQQHWSQRRYAAFTPLLIYMDSFAHAHLAERRAKSRDQLVRSFGLLPTGDSSSAGALVLGIRGRTPSHRLAHAILAQELFATVESLWPNHDVASAEDCLLVRRDAVEAELVTLRNEVGQHRSQLLR